MGGLLRDVAQGAFGSGPEALLQVGGTLSGPDLVQDDKHGLLQAGIDPSRDQA
jgi:hypothetical protein